ncbi:LIM/homeobox protein Lhx9 [Biomphalaria glabrata]|nr:LIM/homeobox protein Lhx9-like [Biomphalaria glabrata]
MSPRGRHMDCVGPLGHDRLDCGGLGYGPERPDYARPMGASDPLDRVPDRMDYAEHGHMHHMGHDRFIECSTGAPHDRLDPHDFDSAVGEDRLGCGGPDANMNTMSKMGPHLRHSGQLMADDDIKDEYQFLGYGLVPGRSCIDHHRRPMPALTSAEPEVPGFCAGCGGRILDRYYLHAVEKQWHTHCLTCSDCHFRLDSELTCFARDGNIYCKTDYYRRFAVKNCARCQMPISVNELIMRAKDQVFHLTCFACSACNRTLKSGEQYGVKEGLIYCRMDYELMFQGEFSLPSMSPGMGPHGAHSPGGGGGGPIPFYNGVGAVQKGRPRKRKSPMSDPDGCTGLAPLTPLNRDLEWGKKKKARFRLSGEMAQPHPPHLWRRIANPIEMC